MKEKRAGHARRTERRGPCRGPPRLARHGLTAAGKQSAMALPCALQNRCLYLHIKNLLQREKLHIKNLLQREKLHIKNLLQREKFIIYNLLKQAKLIKTCWHCIPWSAKST